MFSKRAAAATPPNIVYILADDLGYGDAHFLNRQRGKLPTPNIDRLASQGVAFTDAHGGSAVCSPTRYGILTGRYCWRSRLQQGVLQPYDAPLIPRRRLTVPLLLRSHSYATACIGKWHLGWDWPRENGKLVFDRPIPGGPTDVGFDYYFGTDVPNYPPYCFIENNRTVGIPSIPKPQSMYGAPGIMLPGWKLDAILPALAEKATGYIERQAARGSPFFLYLALTSPHTPLAVAQKWKGRSGFGLYGDWVMQTDWVVGRVMETIDRLPIADNTLVIFTSDNGCAPYIGVDYNEEHDRMGRVKELEARGHYPSAWFRGYKSDIWEGGHRIPFIARWPGVTKPGSRCEQTICLTDLMATCAELLGVKLPENAGEDSVSTLPALRGTTGHPLREATVHHSWFGRFAIRQGRWKLTLCAGSGGWSEPTEMQAIAEDLPRLQLYDLETDPSERSNLERAQPDKVRNLTRLLEQYLEKGRSTSGAWQENDVRVDLWKRGGRETKVRSD